MKNIIKKMFCIHKWEEVVHEKVRGYVSKTKIGVIGTNRVWVCKHCKEMKIYHV